MCEGGQMNRLADATSPYLLQHADNPVDWWPWCDEAFAEARRRDVPVLISVGYAACHWCHVMAHESFEDEAVAALVNERLRADQGGPRGAARRRRRLHDRHPGDDRAGRLADDRLRHAGRRAVLLRHLLSPRRNFVRLLDVGRRRAWRDQRDAVLRQGAAVVEAIGGAAGRGGPTAPMTAGLLDAAAAQLGQEFDPTVRRLRRRAEVPAAHEPAVPAAAPPAHR